MRLPGARPGRPGDDLVDLAAGLEEAGRAALPGPFLANVRVARGRSWRALIWALAWALTWVLIWTLAWALTWALTWVLTWAPTLAP